MGARTCCLCPLGFHPPGSQTRQSSLEGGLENRKPGDGSHLVDRGSRGTSEVTVVDPRVVDPRESQPSHGFRGVHAWVDSVHYVGSFGPSVPLSRGTAERRRSDAGGWGLGLLLVPVGFSPSWLGDSPVLPRGRTGESETWRRFPPRRSRFEGGWKNGVPSPIRCRCGRRETVAVTAMAGNRDGVDRALRVNREG